MAVPTMVELTKELNEVCENHRKRCTSPEELLMLFQTVTRSCIALGASIGAAYVCRSMAKFPDENMPIVLCDKLMATLNEWSDSLKLAPSKN